MRYHVSVEHKGDRGLGGGVWSGFNVEAETRQQAEEIGLVRFGSERGSTIPGRVTIEPILKYDVTFAYRADRRRRETFVVEGYSEAMALANARYVATRRGGLDHRHVVKIKQR